MNPQDYRRMEQEALGKKKAPLVLKNAQVVNVFTDEIIAADVALDGRWIVGVGDYTGEQEVDLKGKYLCPGLVDTHLHFESALVRPQELVVNAAAFGTTTFIADPHESANVSGLDGIRYILEQTEQVPANVFVMMPSCVPAAPFEDNGCQLEAAQMAELANHPRILGLGEVMDYRSVVEGAPSMYDKLQLFRGRPIDGHAPFLNPYDLNGYTMAGVRTDHECVTFEYALEERRRGMQILIREGSAAKNLDAIVGGIVEHQLDCAGFCFCTDDKHIDDIRQNGSISYSVKRSIELGIPPITAIKMATIHATNCYGLRRLGAVAPGYQADLVVVCDLESFDVEEVWHKGVRVSRNQSIPACTVVPCPKQLKNTIHIQPLTEEDFRYSVDSQPQPVVSLVGGQIMTKRLDAVLPSKDGWMEANQTFNKAAVIERHRATGKIGLGAVAGFEIRGGAIASSVAHDSHNLVVIGDNDRDMLCAVRELCRIQGGYVLVENGQVVGSVPLPIMGLMSEEGFQTVQERLGAMIEKAHQMGVRQDIAPFITLSFLALPVIPEIRITARGLYSVTDERFLSC